MVAYLLPGFIALAGIAPLSPVVVSWLGPLNQSQASLGAPVYAVLAATTIGMIASCFRWLLIDHLLNWTGLHPPHWDDDRLQERVVAFNYLVDNHYRYYQFFANTLVAALFAYPVNRLMATSPMLGFGTDLALLILCAALFAGSRDALSKYYTRTHRLLGRLEEKGGTPMTNGNHHECVPTTTRPSRPKDAPQAKPHSELKPRPDKPAQRPLQK